MARKNRLDRPKEAILKEADEGWDRFQRLFVKFQGILAAPVAAAYIFLDTVLRDVLPSGWGKGKTAIVDGTHIELIENNLLGELHIRYGGYGGVAYQHISDTYIALFSNFIACGVWEAVYILDGMIAHQPIQDVDTIHADTQGQSEPVFALAHLLGIQLMPRMRKP
jgi:TnpA family transposase